MSGRNNKLKWFSHQSFSVQVPQWWLDCRANIHGDIADFIQVVEIVKHPSDIEYYFLIASPEQDPWLDFQKSCNCNRCETNHEHVSILRKYVANRMQPRTHWTWPRSNELFSTEFGYYPALCGPVGNGIRYGVIFLDMDYVSRNKNRYGNLLCDVHNENVHNSDNSIATYFVVGRCWHRLQCKRFSTDET